MALGLLSLDMILPVSVATGCSQSQYVSVSGLDHQLKGCGVQFVYCLPGFTLALASCLGVRFLGFYNFKDHVLLEGEDSDPVYMLTDTTFYRGTLNMLPTSVHDYPIHPTT